MRSSKQRIPFDAGVWISLRNRVEENRFCGGLVAEARVSRATRAQHSIRCASRIFTARPSIRIVRKSPRLVKTRSARESYRQRLLAKLLEQRLGVFQISGVEALGEPVVDVGELRVRFVAFALLGE